MPRPDCRLHLDAHDHLTAKIAELDALIAEAAAPFAAVIARLSHRQQALARLGCQVTLIPPGMTARHRAQPARPRARQPDASPAHRQPS